MQGLGDPIFNTTRTKYHEARKRTKWDHTTLIQALCSPSLFTSSIFAMYTNQSSMMLTIAIQPSSHPPWGIDLEMLANPGCTGQDWCWNPTTKIVERYSTLPFEVKVLFSDVLLLPLFAVVRKLYDKQKPPRRCSQKGHFETISGVGVFVFWPTLKGQKEFQPKSQWRLVDCFRKPPENSRRKELLRGFWNLRIFCFHGDVFSGWFYTYTNHRNWGPKGPQHRCSQ